MLESGHVGEAGARQDKEPRMASKQAEFERVAVPHLDEVYRLARQLARDPAEADDLVQETFLRAFRGFDGFELRDYGAKPWLLRILHNAFYTRLGKRSRQPRLMEDIRFDELAAELDEPAAAEFVDLDVDWEYFDDELKRAVEAIAPEYREVLLLWSLAGLSYREIADVCDCAIGTVMSRLYRARQQVGQRLAGYARERGLRSERFDT